ncbi:hypothetical protein PsorP6_001352 [Peronosclerospora sorghi]|uniref:Uncharacterized protein n=1 Tax=Peronosclerospora sorghi TaxID=230839 RepID=A0ACC0WYI6_9STRA|nr:hypothetical protein PsorP6_001352 [Peronosclerospora sorghi]
MRNEELNGRTPLEMLLDELRENNVLHAHERDGDGRIKRVFFAPPKSVQMAKENPDVVLMDSTYKTNRAVKTWITASTGDLTDVYRRLMLAVDHQEAIIRRQIAHNRADTLLQQQGSIWAEVRRKVSHYALNLVHEQLRKVKRFGDAAAQCTNAFTRTMALPCAHRIRDMLATTGHLKMEYSSDHWWLTHRSVHDPAHTHTGDAVKRVSQMEQALTCIQVRHVHLPPHQLKILDDQLCVLFQGDILVPVQEPDIIRDRGSPRDSRGRHHGANSTRRDPSEFEIVDQQHN